ncbi:MAG: PAS domain-containing protein [Bacteroidia bacterium]|nr:PAS domain-containing protein [Bacteroidia bacterium]
MTYTILTSLTLGGNILFSIPAASAYGIVELTTVHIIIGALIIISLSLLVICAILIKKLRDLSVELNRLTLVAQESDNAIVIFSAGGKPEWVNAGFTRWNGYTLEEFIAAKGNNLFEMESVKEMPLLNYCRENKTSVSYQARISTKDNSKMWIQTTLTPILSDSGEILKFIAIDTNIDKLKLAEQELQQQREEIKTQAEQLNQVNRELENLSMVARKTDNSVVIADKNGNIEWINEGFIKLFGYSSLDEFKQLIGTNLLEISKHSDIRSAIKACTEKKESLIYESLIPTKTGTNIWIQSTLTPIFDDTGNIARLIEIDTDITKIKTAEEEIRQQKEEIQTQAELLFNINKELEKLSIIASKTDNSIVICNEHGVIEWINEGFTKLFGYTIEEFIKEKGDNIFETSYNPQIRELFNYCIEKKESVVYSSLNSTKSGNAIWVQTTLTPILDDSGAISKIVAIDTDITKLKDAEEEITKKSELLAETNKELKTKNIQIMDSINYAKLIQEAILPESCHFELLLPEHFIFYKPRDIVSGDFYWLMEKNNFIYAAVIDCTGHGVPGAFMSMIGNTLLNEIVADNEAIEPSVILDKLNEKVIFALKQGGENTESQGDGMDISLCRIDNARKEILIACAYQSVFAISGNEIITINGESFSIGGIFNKQLKQRYTDHVIKIEKETSVYMLSDGYLDQFGGVENEKFLSANFKNLIKDIHHLNMKEQSEIINTTFLNWKGLGQQIDDITVLGFKI